MDGGCKRCGVIETERHLFFQCLFATRVWELIPAKNQPNPNSISTPASFLTACERMINLPPTGLHSADIYPWVLWYMWSTRNKLLFDNLLLSEQNVATLVLKEARIWQAAQAETIKVPLPNASFRVPQSCGNKEVTKCFVDVAWNATTRGGGFGCILKELNNKTIHQKSTNRCCVGSAFITEALAVKKGLLEAIGLGLRMLTLWSYS